MTQDRYISSGPSDPGSALYHEAVATINSRSRTCPRARIFRARVSKLDLHSDQETTEGWIRGLFTHPFAAESLVTTIEIKYVWRAVDGVEDVAQLATLYYHVLLTTDRPSPFCSFEGLQLHISKFRADPDPRDLKVNIQNDSADIGKLMQ